nr:histidine ammonia-lyase [Tetrasphaera australiensis]
MGSVTSTVILGDEPLTIDQVEAVARSVPPGSDYLGEPIHVEVSEAAWGRVRHTRSVVEGLADDTVAHYGISTGFGALATMHIPVDKRHQLQRSLIRSHAAGAGPEVEREVVRALMLLRIQTLATGRTGIREETLRAYVAMLNAGITPVVHEYGSLGCSGDLAPLAHCALALMGEGTVRDAAGDLRSAGEALAASGIEPVDLAEKEGLALINGTDGMLGMLCMAIADLRALVTVADIAAAMSVEGLLGTDDVFAADLQALRPQPGQAFSAANMRKVLAVSEIRDSHRDPDACTRVQDAYSLRCAPQVAGAVRDTIDHAARVAGWELASAVDNPVVTLDDRVESNGNFHGAPVAYVLDFLAIAAADLASMSERRTDRFLDKARNHGLHAFLADDPGVDSGLMIAQYTQAAMVSEMKRLAAPASVDSIPSSAMQEDHVSMGWGAARKLRRSVDALTHVLTIELLAAARGIQLRAPLRPSPVSAAVIAALDEVTRTAPGPDRILADDIAEAVYAVADGSLLAAAEAAAGPLN